MRHEPDSLCGMNRIMQYADFREWTVNEKYYLMVSQLLSSLGVKVIKLRQGQLEFAARNFTLLIDALQSLKIITGLAEGALDFYFYVKPRFPSYGQGAHGDLMRKFDAGDVTHRFEKMSANVGSNIHFLLDSLRKSLLQEEFESRDLLLQMVNECSKHLSNLTGHNENTDLIPRRSKVFLIYPKLLAIC